MESLFIWARFWSGEIEAFFSRWRDIEIFLFFLLSECMPSRESRVVIVVLV
jgi:hypothetical protein